MKKRHARIKTVFAFTWMVLLSALGLLNAGEERMLISSTAFSDGSRIPVIYTRPAAGGRNISPPIFWEHIPDGTKSLALSVVDPHPVAKNWVHWLVINIPKGCKGLSEGASRKTMPTVAKELRNSFGEIGYGGPQPPPGTGDHPYVFTVYALNTDQLDLPEDTTLQEFTKAIKGHILGYGSLTGYFGR